MQGAYAQQSLALNANVHTSVVQCQLVLKKDIPLKQNPTVLPILQYSDCNMRHE
jgi:hypothetical protein